MDNQIVIHAAGSQKRIALIENGELAQFFIESPENRRSVGDIYLAQVHKVMSGIRASFIDLSTPKDGFLHYSDLGEHLEAYLSMLNGRDSIPKKASEELLQFRQLMAKNEVKNMTSKDQTMHEQNLLGALLKPGQKVMVQVVKEPIGSKGPRVSTDITLAGRFLVLIPFGDYVAVSKRIRSYKERRRLKGIISEMLPNGFGVIVRTVAEGQADDVLREDLKDLHDKWVNMQEKLKTAKPTALLHRDLDMTESLIRDLFSKNYERILVDDTETFKSIKGYIGRVAPSMVKNVEQYKGRDHVFDHMNISRDVNSIFSPRVKMPSGGYLIFEQTEAMYVVDVNSGRYAAKKAQEDNSLKTNLEAAREIAKQLRLRDIGGIIVVDFIDLQQDANRKKIYDEIKKEFKKDRAKTNILPMSDFGLMQITRQRIRPSVVKSVSKVCPMCGGSGSIVSESTLLSDIEAWLSKFSNSYSYRSVDLYVNPFFHSVLLQGVISTRVKWMFKFFRRITILPDETISLNDFKATLHGSEFDIHETVSNGDSIEEAIKENEKNLAELESGGRKNTDLLDIYKKNGRKNGNETNGQQRRSPNRDDAQGSRNDGRSGSANRRSGSQNQNQNQSQSQDDGQERGRKRPAAVRITPQGRSNNKLKSKYYKSGGDDDTKGYSDNDSQQRSNRNTSSGSQQQADSKPQKPDAPEVAKAHAKEEVPNALDVAKAHAKEDVPNALDIAKAHARKVQREETSEEKKDAVSQSDSSTDQTGPAAGDGATVQTKDESAQTTASDSKQAETESRQADSTADKQQTPETDEAQETKPAQGREQAGQPAAESAEQASSDTKYDEDAAGSDGAKPKLKAPKRVKRAPRAGGKKVMAKPPKTKKSGDNKEDSPEADAEKTSNEQPPKGKTVKTSLSDAKAAKLREMDELKAKLSEETFRKPAAVSAQDDKKTTVVTKTVTPRKPAAADKPAKGAKSEVSKATPDTDSASAASPAPKDSQDPSAPPTEKAEDRDN
ncbi:ribonuclease, Rne/Rng family [Cyclonatronum proteinivorum]|uniref:Ribonuclease, Rne/Rng family n=1 Tax=Cyclonatronum proteinivorum TaxID=1457365 RepID=A0A345UM09_9BACT|nr:Rne/Rng family ribonuclease [Cyclonatronum proteinivorum]AXJ01511.1 ribonuclease, Rne/Rng family [Cyclonatronum proteinivorum]